MFVVFRLVNTWLPDIALVPLHAPLAAQLLLALLLQVSVALAPTVTAGGFASRVTECPVLLA